VPKLLADYAPTSLRAHFDRKAPTPRSLKRSSDGHLALVVDAVSRKFDVRATRNRQAKITKNDYRPDCACRIVAKAAGKSESLIEKIWNKNKNSARDIVAEFLELDHDLDQILSRKSERQALRSRPQRHEPKKMISENRKSKSGAMAH